MQKLLALPTYLQVLLSGFLLFGVFFLMVPDRVEVDPKQLPWNAYIDDNEQLHALGVIVNKSTVAEAKQIFGNDMETKIFSQKDETGKSLEAYFPSVYVGSIHAAILLKINIPAKELDETYARGTGTTVNQAGNREINLSGADQTLLAARTFSSITMIPRKNLTETAIRKRFGEPERIETQDDKLDHWFYPKMGLELLYDKDGPEALQFNLAEKP